MLRSLDKRLRKLESGQAAELDKEKEFDLYFHLFLLDAFGYYFGGPNPSESPRAATARALEYEHEGEHNGAIKEGTDPEPYAELERAERTLFAKFGVDLGSTNGQEIADAAKRIYAGLPISYKTETRIKPIHDGVWQCRPLDLGPVAPRSRKSRVFTLDVRRHFERSSVP
jgi:hypothetical protein